MAIQPGVKLWALLAAVFAVFGLVVFLVLEAPLFLSKLRPDIVIESAVRHRDVQAVRRYIAAGSNVRIRIHPSRYGDGYTPLHVACEKGFPEIVKILIDAGADVDASDNLGNTPLMACVVADDAPGQSDCARLLIEAGADVARQDEDGNTALHFAHVSTRGANVFIGERARIIRFAAT